MLHGHSGPDTGWIGVGLPSLNEGFTHTFQEKIMVEIKVWDPLVRIVHWALALSILGAALTADHSSWLTVHIWFGSLAVLLAVTRLLWGLVGSRHARFSSFLLGLRGTMLFARRMARRKAPRLLGHNPVAGWVMMGMLLLVLLIALTGLGALGGQEQIGPLSGWMGFKAGHFFKELHEGLSGFLWAAVGLHMVGIAVHMLLHRENIVRAMITGRKRVDPGDPRMRSRPEGRMAWRVGMTLIPVLALAPWLVLLPTDYRAPTTQAALSGVVSPVAQVWRKECGACHFALPPELMPERSWRHVFATLGEHYGKDAWLPERKRALLAGYAEAHSADRVPTEASYRIWRGMDAGETPLSIVESRRWKRKHRKIESAVFSQANVGSPINCEACHRLALAGSFEDADIAIPPAAKLLQAVRAPGGEERRASLQ